MNRVTTYGILIACFYLAIISTSYAQSLSSRLFNQTSGLTNLDPDHLIETRSGAIIATTQGASFVFDGHSFLPLGAEQGLPDSTAVNDITLGPDGRTIVASQENRLLIAQDPSPFSLVRLHFRTIALPVNGRYVQTSALSAFGNGVAVSTGHDLLYLSLDVPAEPKFIVPPPQITRANRSLRTPLDVYGNGTDLWVSDHDGRICVFGATRDHCWAAQEGLPTRRWGGFLATGGRSVIVRTGNIAAILDPQQASVRLEMIPDNVPALDGLSRFLRIDRAANGDLITQAVHGVAVRHDGVWHAITLTDGFNQLLPMAIDRAGSIWLGLLGEGVRQYVGWGAIDNLTRLGGLSNGVVWGIIRAQDGRLWIATDGGLDLLSPGKPPRPSFENRSIQSLAVGRPGILWMSVNASTLVRLDTRTGAKTEYPFPDISTVHTAPDGTAWVATGDGLYRLEDDGRTRPTPVLSSAHDTSLTDLVIDPDGTIWLTGSGMLWRKRPGEDVRPFVRQWGEPKVNTETLAHRPGGPIWVGTLNGLFRVDTTTLQPRVTKIDPDRLPDRTIGAIIVDRRNNVWVGTSSGVAILHDGQWVSADMTSGLVGNDVAQDGIYEDADGSIWIGTAQGLSHILKPDILWQLDAPHPSIQKVTVDGVPYHGEMLPYAHPRLDVWIGLLGGRRGGRTFFRYQIAGIAPRWQALLTDHLVYPALPPGQHRLLIETVDPDTRAPSDPITLVITIRLPWWRQPWAYAGYVVLLIGTGWLLLRLRTRYLMQQRARLEATVRAQTADLLDAHAALEAQSRQLVYRATHDGLTGLLNRAAVQESLTKALTGTIVPRLAVSLIDIDHFKRLNDTHGHLVGDAALVALGERFRHQLAPDETIGRYGGEEYVLLVPQSGSDGFRRVTAIIDTATASPFAIEGLTLTLSVSAGVAVADEGDSWNSIIRRADRALYQAKRNGRARIVPADGVFAERYQPDQVDVILKG